MCRWCRIRGGAARDLQRNLLWVLLCQRHRAWHQPRSVMKAYSSLLVLYTFLVTVGKSWLLSTLGMELDWATDVRRRIQETSYIQEQYILTRCSLSSEHSLQTQSQSHIGASSNSDSVGGPLLPDPNSSDSVLETGSLPQGLEKMPLPEQRSSLSRWADSTWQQKLSAEKKVRLSNTRHKSLVGFLQKCKESCTWSIKAQTCI